jgi:hypothetical protein
VQEHNPSQPAGPDWATGLVDRLESITDIVDRRALLPVRRATRFIVYGSLAVLILPIILVFLSIFGVRLLNSYAFEGRDWASLTLIGGILSLGGLFLWTRRTKEKGDSD